MQRPILASHPGRGAKRACAKRAVWGCKTPRPRFAPFVPSLACLCLRVSAAFAHRPPRTSKKNPSIFCCACSKTTRKPPETQQIRHFSITLNTNRFGPSSPALLFDPHLQQATCLPQENDKMGVAKRTRKFATARDPPSAPFDIKISRSCKGTLMLTPATGQAHDWP